MVVSDNVSDLHHARESSICLTTQRGLLGQIHNVKSLGYLSIYLSIFKKGSLIDNNVLLL